MIGQSILHYRVLEKLGEGGMGVVYKAQDTRLDRLIAIKILPADKISDPERKRRFVQEAKAASGLNHPNIVTIYDIGQADGIDFMSKEYVAGKTLDRLIPRHGMRLTMLIHQGRQENFGPQLVVRRSPPQCNPSATYKSESVCR